MLDKENKAAQAHLDNENKVQKKVDKFKEKLLVNKIFDKERRENAKKLQIEKDNLEKQEKEAKNIEIENCEKEEIAKKLQIGKENDEAAKEVKVKVSYNCLLKHLLYIMVVYK